MRSRRGTQPKQTLKDDEDDDTTTTTTTVQVVVQEAIPNQDDLVLPDTETVVQQVVEQPVEEVEELEELEDKNLSFFLSMVQTLDSGTLLSAISQRLFDHFTMFDLLLAKGKQNPKRGVLNSAIDDMGIMMVEMRMLIENCMDPVKVGKLAIKKKSEDCLEIDELLTLAMGMDTNVWLKKSPANISYRHRMLDIDCLFGQKGSDGAPNVRVKKEKIDDENEKNENKENSNTNENKGEKRKAEGESSQSPKKKTPKKYRPRSEILEERSKGDFKCGKCGKGYMNSTAWYKHMETTCASKTALKISIRTIGEKFYCAYKFCNTPKRPFKTRDDVHDHWALHHVTEEMKIFPCFMCQDKFATTGAQKLHMRLTHLRERLEKAAEENPKAVEKVGNKIVIKKKAPRTITDDDQRGSKEKYLCLKCGQSMTKATGKKHEEKCTGMQVRRPEYKKVNDEFFCTVAGCMIGYGFPSMYGLNKHFHTTHTREEEKYFACDYCDEKFSFNTTRNKHVAEKHLKNYVCDLCGKGFGGKSKLNSHRMLHTGEKPFACNRCDYRAAKKSNYEAHMESKHGVFTQKNFVCAVCNKQFQTMGRIRHHMNLVHAQGENEEEQKLLAKRQKRHKMAPPVEKQLSKREAKKLKKITMPPVVTTVNVQAQPHPHPHPQQAQPQPQPQYHNPSEEQEAAVQYIQAELGQGDERVITIRPLY